MRNILLTLPLIIFLLIIAIFFYFLYAKNDPKNLPSVLIDKKAPNFVSFSLIEENQIIYSEVNNKQPVIINFFASWCIPCEVEIQYLSELSNYNEIKIIGINYKDDPIKARRWLKKVGNPYDIIAIDPAGEISIDWGVYGIPETFLINHQNYIKYKVVGPITKENFKDLNFNIKKLINEYNG